MYLMNWSTKKGGNEVIDSVLIDLMSDIDVSLLDDNFLEEDLMKQQNTFTAYVKRRMHLNKRDKFEISDSLRSAIMEQNERNGMPEIREKIEIKVEKVKNKFRFMIQVVSWIAAMVVLLISVILILIKRKSSAKLLRKKIQATW